MIATGLVFALGALMASLLALLFAPILWHKAQRLARREFEATIPTEVNEIRAEIDAVRAASAFHLRRQEMEWAQARDLAARDRAEAGRIVLENGALLVRFAELEDELAQRSAAFRVLEEQIHALTGERDELHETRQDLKRNLQKRTDDLHALAAKYQALGDLSDEQRLRLAAAETRIMELSGALRAGSPRSRPALAQRPEEPGAPHDRAAPPMVSNETAPASDRVEVGAVTASQPIGLPVSIREPISGSNRLRAAIAARAGMRRDPAHADQDPARAENAEIRERISDIAARVIQKQVEVEGPDSVVARLIAQNETDKPTAALTIAERVKRLMADNPPAAAQSSAEPVDSAQPVSVSPAPARAKRNGGGRSRPKSRR